METAVAEPAHTPSYLAQIEQLVGVQFFADGQVHNFAHAYPDVLNAEIRATYAGTYIAGLRLLAAARREWGKLPYELTPAQRQEVREDCSEEIATIQTQLLDATEVEAPADAITPGVARRELHLSQSMLSTIFAEREPILVPYKCYPNSATGTLYLSSESARIVQQAANEISVAGEGDIAVSRVCELLQTDSGNLQAECDAYGIIPRGLRPSSTAGYMFPYITRAQLGTLRRHYAKLEDNRGLKSIREMAVLAGTDHSLVRAQIEGHNWDGEYMRRRQRDKKGAISHALYLPNELADVIIAELSVIVSPLPAKSMLPLDTILQALPEDKRPTPRAATKFVTANGGEVLDFNYYGKYLIGVSAGLINYNFGRPGTVPQKIGDGWLNREQLAHLTDQPLDVVDADLQALDWNSVRPELRSIHVPGFSEGPRNRSAVHVLWHKPKNSSVVLPHYNPAIVQRIITIAKKRRTDVDTTSAGQAAA